MKKLMFVLLLSCITLVACDGYDESKINNTGVSNKYLQGYSSKYHILEDNETGCKYIKFDAGYQGSIAPYYDKNGNVMGCKDNEEEM